MKLILRGRRFGFQLEDIRQWLLIYEKDGTKPQMQAFVEMADRQLVDLAEQKQQIEEAMSELRKLRSEAESEID